MLTACTNCCGGSVAKAWCLDCVEALCQDCVAAHKRVKVTRCHRILNQRPEDFPKSDSAARAIFCSIHPKEVIQLYCFTCDLLTCRDCQLMDHRTHDFQFVCMAYQSIRKQMYRVLKPVDKHTETAMQSIQVMSSRLKDIHSNKAKLKLSFETLVKTFCLQFKQRLSQHYAQVVAIYKSEEEILRNTMQGLLEKVEEYTIRMRTIEDDTTDIKTLLARKAEMKRWSKWILSQEVSPPKSMTKATITINTTSWKAILSLGELQVSYVPFACNESNSPEVAGASAPTPAAASATTCTDSPPLPLTALPQTSNVGSSLQSSSDVGSSLQSSSNVGSSLQSSSNVGLSLHSSSDVGSSLHSSSYVGSSLQSSSNVGSSLHSASNVGSSLQSSRNVGSSLQSSRNVGSSLQSSSNVGSSLQSSSNVGSSLQSSSNVGSNLQSFRNVGSSRQSSSNVGSSLQSSSNVGSSLQSSSNVGSSLHSSSDVGSSLHSSSDVGSSLHSSSDVGSSLQSSSDVGSRLKRINNIGSRLKRINNIELNVKRISQSQKVTTTTQSPPTCNYQWYSHAMSGHSGMNSDRSLVVQNAQPLPLKDSAECTPIGAQTSLAPVHPANHPSYRVLPTGTNFYPVIASSSIMKHTGSTMGGPNENFIMVGAPIVSSHPTLVLDQHSEPVNDIMQANPSSASLFHQNKAQSSLNPAAPKALPCPAVCYSSSYNRGTSHDVGVPAGHLTHNQILPVTNVPSPPSKQPHTPQDVAPSRAEEVMARNPLLYQIILKCLSSSGYTGNAGTSGPEHTQPIPASKDAPPSPQGPLPTTEIVKGLADSACDVSSNQGSENGSQAPNIQENKLISTVSDTKLLQDIPSIVSERLSVWEDGGELSDTKDVKPPTYSGVQEATPASPACPEPHLEAGCTQAAGALAEDPASPESPEEDLVDPEPLGEEPSEDDPAEVGGLASTEGPCNYSPVVSLFRLPLLSVAPGRPLPRIFIHAGDTDQEMYLEEKIEDDVSAASSMSEGLQLSAVLGVDADGSLLDPVSKGADQQPASAPGGDPGPGQDADQEEKAGPSRRRPKKRSKVAEKMKETRKRLRAFLETSSSLPTKKRAVHQGTIYMV